MDKERPKVSARNEFERSKTISALQKAIDAGLNSGPGVSFDSGLFKRNMHETRS